jgi:excisionase family DNA binding protein
MRGMREDYVSTNDAAAALGISRQRVLQLIKTGRLRAEKFANVYMIHRPDLSAVEDRPQGRPPNKTPATATNRATGKARGSNGASVSKSAKRGGKR